MLGLSFIEFISSIGALAAGTVSIAYSSALLLRFRAQARIEAAVARVNELTEHDLEDVEDLPTDALRSDLAQLLKELVWFRVQRLSVLSLTPGLEAMTVGAIRNARARTDALTTVIEEREAANLHRAIRSMLERQEPFETITSRMNVSARRVREIVQEIREAEQKGVGPKDQS